MRSKIISCVDLEYAKNYTLDLLKNQLVKSFFCEDFKIEDAKEVTKEAYIAEENTKYIIIAAKTFNIYAQNSLLKLLEEPPKNVVFFILVKSKSLLLPTIRSRLALEVLRWEEEEYELELDLKYMDFNDIFLFLKENRYLKKDELKIVIKKIVKKALLELKIDFNEYELNMFDKLMILSELNSRSQNLLAYLLLLIYRKRNDQKIKQSK